MDAIRHLVGVDVAWVRKMAETGWSALLPQLSIHIRSPGNSQHALLQSQLHLDTDPEGTELGYKELKGGRAWC